MKTIVRVIGEKAFNEFGTAVSNTSPGLVDGRMNVLSTKISEIISGTNFLIYCEKGYKNIWTAGFNWNGQCAANTIKSVEDVESDGIHRSTQIFCKQRDQHYENLYQSLHGVYSG